jgi:probable F420-dependent oxidoreductase
MADDGMRFGLAPPNVGTFGDPRAAVKLAATAEAAGWDGYFVWDVLGFMWDHPQPTFDPWVILSAVAAGTERIRLGTDVAVLPRYQPHLLAMTLASLDVLSGGRLILGVGLGESESELSAFGQTGDVHTRAEKVDEALEVMTRLWSGEEVVHRGKHYTVEHVRLAPTPVQQPRIPIWIGGGSPAALRRAGRWDGWFGPPDPSKDWAPDDLAGFRRRIDEERGDGEPVDIGWGGSSTPDDRDRVAGFRRAGATWWIEVIEESRGGVEEWLGRISQGPPR